MRKIKTAKYMFFVFLDIKLWNIPIIDIETIVMERCKKTYETIKSGIIVRYIKDGKKT